MYEESGSLSNGAGDFIFTGRQDSMGGGNKRRALIAFDIAGSVPSGVTITAVTLQLTMSRTSSTSKTVSLHSLTKDWGEGASHAADREFQGANAIAPDATWTHSMFNTVTWSSACVVNV